jgi:predicted nucleic acid-binding protein
MIIIDTDVLIEILDKKSKTGAEALAKIELTGEEVAITSLTLHEVLYGIYKYGKDNKVGKIKLLDALSFSKSDANLSSKIEIACEKRGLKISRIDAMIGAIAINRNSKLFTFNKKHFEGMRELKLF